jgi:cell division transport system permease protein
MSFAYTVRESFSGFRRTKLSTLISIITIIISLVLLGVFAVVTTNATRLIEEIRAKMEMEAFLTEPLTPDIIAATDSSIGAVEGVERVQFISKEDAARIFKEEFGEDISTVLDFNPLPPSYKIFLKREYRTAANAERIHNQISRFTVVDTVIYRKALMEFIDERAATFNTVTLGLGLLISLSAIFLVSNTVRLAIYARRRILRTMELVGATRMFIRMPFLLEGLIQGIIGGVVAAGLLYAALVHGARYFSAQLASYIQMDPVFYVLVALTGVALGLVGSAFSVVRFIRLGAGT